MLDTPDEGCMCVIGYRGDGGTYFHVVTAVWRHGRFWSPRTDIERTFYPCEPDWWVPMEDVRKAVEYRKACSAVAHANDMVRQALAMVPKTAEEYLADEFPNNTCPLCGASRQNGHTDSCTKR